MDETRGFQRLPADEVECGQLSVCDNRNATTDASQIPAGFSLSAQPWTAARRANTGARAQRERYDAVAADAADRVAKELFADGQAEATDSSPEERTVGYTLVPTVYGVMNVVVGLPLRCFLSVIFRDPAFHDPEVFPSGQVGVVFKLCTSMCVLHVIVVALAIGQVQDGRTSSM